MKITGKNKQSLLFIFVLTYRWGITRLWLLTHREDGKEGLAAFFFFKQIFNWRKIALQCGVAFPGGSAAKNGPANAGLAF